jgi:hypothetical protein
VLAEAGIEGAEVMHDMPQVQEVLDHVDKAALALAGEVGDADLVDARAELHEVRRLLIATAYQQALRESGSGSHTSSGMQRRATGRR